MRRDGLTGSEPPKEGTAQEKNAYRKNNGGGSSLPPTYLSDTGATLSEN